MIGAVGGVRSTIQWTLPAVPTLPAASVPVTTTTCVPSARLCSCQPLTASVEQSTGALLSSTQLKLTASPSTQVMLASVDRVGPMGATETVGESGAVLSTRHVTVPGVLFMFRRSSSAYTYAVCCCSVRSLSGQGEVQAVAWAGLESSNAHLKYVVAGSVFWKVTFAVTLRVGVGNESTDGGEDGGVRSTNHVYTYVFGRKVAYLATFSENVCVPDPMPL